MPHGFGQNVTRITGLQSTLQSFLAGCPLGALGYNRGLSAVARR
jgi:hypothetical protein